MPDNTALVATTVLITVGTAELGKLVAGNKPTVKPVIGGFVLGIGLFGLNSISSTLGKQFSILIIVSALLLNGGPIFARLNWIPPVKNTTAIPGGVR